MRAVTAGRGARQHPRYSPDGKWLAYLAMERAGFESDRQRYADGTFGRSHRRSDRRSDEGLDASVGSYTWCPDSKCILRRGR